MNRRISYVLVGLMSTAVYSGFSPSKAEASTQVSFSQVIMEPDCYDQVSSVTGTTDYIATFDCELRRPDGTVYQPSEAAVARR